MTDRSLDPRRIVVGVGNRDRGDDAFGPTVCDRAAGLDPGVEVWIIEADPSVLAVRWRPDDRVVVVDAVVSGGGAAPGSVYEIDVGLTPGAVMTALHPTSTHGIGVADAIMLADALGTKPRELWVLGVEADSFELDAPLADSLAAVVDSVAERALGLLAGCVDRNAERR